MTKAAMCVRMSSARRVLHFTPINAASCVLPRPASRVIHHEQLFLLFRRSTSTQFNGCNLSNFILSILILAFNSVSQCNEKMNKFNCSHFSNHASRGFRLNEIIKPSSVCAKAQTIPRNHDARMTHQEQRTRHQSVEQGGPPRESMYNDYQKL